MSVSNNERVSNPNIKKIDEQIAQLQARKKAIENKEKAKLKKEHTRKLIEYGRLVELYFDCKSVDQLKEMLKNLRK
jgi:hypothetical protein